ncbi:hypothetical protein BT93_G1342 [Corymbia citriodora subsp. variegata]|nr:hypothetical protein BT93_G1342 [Corymbia citriodora subsp. variegata]
MIRFLSTRALRCAGVAAPCDNRGRRSFIHPSARGFLAQAARLLEQCRDDSELLPPPDFDSHSYASILQDCIRSGEPILARPLHCDVIKRGACLDLFASNILLNAYVKSELLGDARILFDELPQRNTISFVTLIQGLAQALRFGEAVELFGRLHREGHELNAFAFTTFLKMLVSVERADMAGAVHACICKLGHDTNAFVGTALVDAYSVGGSVSCAKDVFGGIVFKDMVSWTGIITCCAENGCFEEAMGLFSQMRIVGFKPNNYTFVSVLKACLGMGTINLGRSVHGCTLKTHYELDVHVGVGLLELYSGLGDMEGAQKVFEEIPKKDVVPWSFMIGRYAQISESRKAVELFCQMRRAFVLPNQFTFASLLQACATMESLQLGEQVHCNVLKVGLDSDVFVSNALMDVYSKSGRIDISVKIFEESQATNDVTYNTLIVGFAQIGEGQKALSLFSNMLDHRLTATEVTYSGALCACAGLASLEPGNQIHSLTIKTTYDKNTVVGNSLIDMYAKCGAVKEARLVFDRMRTRDEVSWNTMISAYSMHGLGGGALNIFDMMNASKSRPNKLTFVGVLSACSNSGLMDQGQQYFHSMVHDYGIEPCVEHYTCMVWLLGRLGYLDKAMKLIQEMPFEPSVMVWRALLGACVIHHNVDLGRLSAERVLEMEPHDEAAYVLLSNIYANERRWENVAAVRKKMKRRGIKKEPGLSWFEYQGTVHYFTVGDTLHPDMKLISGMLEWLNMKARQEGFVPNCSAILLAVEDEEKERLLWLHSERLALAFALIKMPYGNPIRIMKNLRICVDCHAAIKLISKVVPREIIIRDINRFHHFHNGACSCADYW